VANKTHPIIDRKFRLAACLREGEKQVEPPLKAAFRHIPQTFFRTGFPLLLTLETAEESALVGFIGSPLKQVARLAIEFAAQRLKSREANCASLVRLKNRQIRDCDIDAVGEFGQTQTTIEHR